MSLVTVRHAGDCLLRRSEIALMRPPDVHNAVEFVDVANRAKVPPDSAGMLARLQPRGRPKLQRRLSTWEART